MSDKSDLPFNVTGGVDSVVKRRKRSVPPPPKRVGSSGGEGEVSSESVSSGDSEVPLSALRRRSRGRGQAPVRRLPSLEDESLVGSREGVRSSGVVAEDEVVEGSRKRVSGKVVRASDSSSRGSGEVVSLSPESAEQLERFGDEVEVVEPESWEVEDEKPKKKKKDGFRLTPRDVRVIDFLGRYRYATKVQAARLTGTSEAAINARMIRMGHAGFLRKESVANGKGVWTPTREGMGVADLDFAPLGAGRISVVTMAHTLGLANLGVEVEVGNGAELFDFPLDSERVVTERMISSSQLRMRKAREVREADDWVGTWEPDDLLLRDAEYDPSGDSPELVPGNEALFVVTSSLYGKEHVPDMVIPMRRGEDGFSRNVAVELELSPKHHSEWKRILMTYMESDVFGSVVYFTHKKTIANALLGIADGIGMKNLIMRKYVPTSEHLIWG